MRKTEKREREGNRIKGETERREFQSLTNDPLRIGRISASRFEKAAGDT